MNLLHLIDIYHQVDSRPPSRRIWTLIDPPVDVDHRPAGDSVRERGWIADNNAPFTGRIAITGSVR
jgi:hypothetical protein